jgi:small nuclear ribonucleoprotein (snRNP)-like protein
MTQSDLQLLKANIDRIVRVHCRDGEVFIGKALSVSEEDQDLIYDLISTSRESQYEKADKQPAYMIRLQDIDSVELWHDTQG